jgi:hypothetical protein
MGGVDLRQAVQRDQDRLLRGEEIGGDLEWTDFFFLFLNQTALINKISSHYNQEDY